MKGFLAKGLVGVLCFTLYGFTTLPAQALPVGILGGAASHLFRFGGTASGLFHASRTIGMTSNLSRTMTYSRGITGARMASSNVYRSAAMQPRYLGSPYPMAIPRAGYRTPGMTSINAPSVPTRASTPPSSPVAAPRPGIIPRGAPLARPYGPWGPAPYWRWDHDDAAWFVGGVFVGAAVTPLFVAEPVYYPGYPEYYVVSSDSQYDSCDKSPDSSTDKNKTNMKSMEKNEPTEPTVN